MKKGKVWMIAAAVCMASLMVLFGGMGVLAMRQGNNREQFGAQKTDESGAGADVIGDVLSEAQEEEDLSWMAGVKILIWDEYYALSVRPEGAADDGLTEIPADGQSSNTTGTGREPLENELSMEEAGILGLKEIRRVYGEDMEGQMLMMYLIDAPDGRHVWDGYCTNYVNGETLGVEIGGVKKPRLAYMFIMNALTGEIISLRHTHLPMEDVTGQALTGEEILAKADAYVQELGLVDLSEYHGTLAADDEYYWQDQEYVDIVRYAREGGEPELGVYIRKDSGRLTQYEYYNGYGFEWEMGMR